MEEVLPEGDLHATVDLLVRLVEAGGAAIIFAGALMAFVRFVVVVVRDRGAGGFVPIRLDLGRFLVLGLEFQLAADLLNTAVAPTFEDIGRVAAIAAIRTVLNFFLRREIAEEAAELEAGEHPREGRARVRAEQ